SSRCSKTRELWAEPIVATDPPTLTAKAQAGVHQCGAVAVNAGIPAMNADTPKYTIATYATVTPMRNARIGEKAHTSNRVGVRGRLRDAARFRARAAGIESSRIGSIIGSPPR